MTVGLKQAILEVVPDYPQKYFESWFRDTYRYTQGIGGTGARPGTQYVLGFLDTCKELNLDIDLCIESTKNWRHNEIRRQAINKLVNSKLNKIILLSIRVNY